MSNSNNTFIDLLNVPVIEHDLYALILKNMPMASKQIIAGYTPTKEEIDVRHLLYILSTNHTIALPEVKGRNLIFKEWDFKEEEPRKSAKKVIPNIILVPCMGIGKNGYRWGHGCKFYDRTIQSLKKKDTPIITIGVAYEHQLSNEYQADKDSNRLDWILTPSQMTKCR